MTEAQLTACPICKGPREPVLTELDTSFPYTVRRQFLCRKCDVAIEQETGKRYYETDDDGVIMHQASKGERL